jgi:hypothetical protein
MMDQSQRNFYVVAALWFVPLLGMGACWWFRGPWWAWGLAILGFISGVIQQTVERSKRSEWRTKISKIEAHQDAG